MGLQAEEKEKIKTERETGLGRGVREEIVKWNQMTALRQGEDTRHSQPPFGGAVLILR